LVTIDDFLVQVCKYRRLGVLELSMNSCFRRVFLPAAIFHISVINVFGMLLTVSIFHEGGSNKSNRASHGEGSLGKAVFPMMMVQGYVAILVLGTLAGALNKTSKAVLGKLRQDYYQKIGRDAYFLAKWKSCAPIKVRFANNFVEMSTPLVILCFCLKVTVRLLLIKEI